MVIDNGVAIGIAIENLKKKKQSGEQINNLQSIISE